jgi:hypothetical protein
LSRCRHCLVALLSPVQFLHHMPSCDRRRSRCRPLSPIIVFHRRHRRHYRHRNSPSYIDEERGSSSSTTSIPAAAPS